MSSITPLQLSSTPLHVSACGGAGVALQTALVPLHVHAPVTAHPPTPTVHVPEILQTPPQFCWPAGQPHAPAVHTIPAPIAPHADPFAAGPVSVHTGRSTMHAVVRPNRQGIPVSHGAPTMHGEQEYGGPSERQGLSEGSTSTVGGRPWRAFSRVIALAAALACRAAATASGADASLLASGACTGGSLPQPTANAASAPNTGLRRVDCVLRVIKGLPPQG
jgi:hypothetical protein